MERDTNGLFVSVPDYEIVNIHHRRHRRSADADQIHQVDLPLSSEPRILVPFLCSSSILPTMIDLP